MGVDVKSFGAKSNKSSDPIGEIVV
jgi:hypothetical protein